MTTTRAVESRTACRVHVTGLVQGVGFRPFVHRLALRHQLGGWVRNESGEVEIAIEGVPTSVDAFVAALRAEAPPLARIETLTREDAAVLGRKRFAILASASTSDRRQPVSPDVAMCAACEAELFDPADRRYRYPFITCTDCGPRFTVITAMPYDRVRTSMAAFPQCPRCLGEYHEPGNRRYHSETNSCPRCGPRLWFSARDTEWSVGAEPSLRRATLLLLSGGVLALRGLGGFHLAVDATDRAAVERLRQRKHRDAKPLAVMVRTLEDARRLADIHPAEAALLATPERPIVLVTRRPDCGLDALVAPGLTQVGLVLAYTPLHHLLLQAVGRPLVMTSGNRSEEPIATANEEALRRLDGIADGFLLHDREIVARYDDSVARVVLDRPVFLRRARGYAPIPLTLPVPSPMPLIAVGAHLKNTFTLVHGRDAYVSQHIGDLESPETLDHFRESLERYQKLFQVVPQAVVHDQHPEYLSTWVARELGLPRVLTVQHHHAHIAAVLAEHGETGPVLGVAFDGTGAGSDGTTWGAEFLIADLLGFRRVGNLLPAPMPGGDLAARAPWRAALGFLSADPCYAGCFALAFEGVDPTEKRIAEQQIAQAINAPVASSMGRLFDAAAAVLGVRRLASYEGQAAMELESLAGHRPAADFPSRFIERDGRLLLDPLPLLAALGAGRQRGTDLAELAAEFHTGIGWASAQMAGRLAHAAGVGTIALGGGVFQNARLLESMVTRLENMGFRVLTPRQLSPNDGAISYGQAAVGAATLAAEQEN
jgi:hydrogenase maturation protein HypF